MLTNATVADVFRPGEKVRGRFYDTGLVIGGALLIALCAQVKFMLPFSPVPITGQTFAVLVTGALLGAGRGTYSVILYLAAGMLGLPVFALGGGFVALLGPTGGYLVGFIPAAHVTGLLAEKGWDRRVGTTIAAMVLGNAVIYAFGLFWLRCLMGADRSVLAVGLYPFLLGDLLKIVLAAALLPSGWKLLRYTGRTEETAG